jgi:hypothetical protein
LGIIASKTHGTISQILDESWQDAANQAAKIVSVMLLTRTSQKIKTTSDNQSKFVKTVDIAAKPLLTTLTTFQVMSKYVAKYFSPSQLEYWECQLEENDPKSLDDFFTEVEKRSGKKFSDLVHESASQVSNDIAEQIVGSVSEFQQIMTKDKGQTYNQAVENADLAGLVKLFMNG